MRRLVWCHNLLADIRTRDITGYDRFATSVIKLPQLLSFGPFPKSTRATVYRNSHDFQPFAGFLIRYMATILKLARLELCRQSNLSTTRFHQRQARVATVRMPRPSKDEIGNDDGRTNQAFTMVALRPRHFQAIGQQQLSSVYPFSS
jgi:hypothetical protein